MNGITIDTVERVVADQAPGSSARSLMNDLPGRVGLVVPTLNAGSDFDLWLAALQSQSLQPEYVLVVDSESSDDTVSRALKGGLTVHSIGRCEFTHGGTRQDAINRLSGADFVLFLTQDAFLADRRSLQCLLQAFRDPKVAVAYGRQLPQPGADPIEAHARHFNYPAASYVRSAKDIAACGIKTSFVSNSFAAWRRAALQEIGGFAIDTIQSEDTYAASKLVMAGWKIAYCAEATVYHSHHYCWRQEFSRYFDTGVFHARQRWIRDSFGQVEGEGLRFAKSELDYLVGTKPHLIGAALVRTGLKWIGFKLGNFERFLPIGLKRLLSMNKQFWQGNV
ncbi:MAG: glycosyltransferase family 2 protein [bacterium]